MLKVFVRHGMIVDKIYEVISCKQSKWLDKYIKFNTQKRSKARNEFEKVFHKLLNNVFHEKTLEIVRNCLRLEFIKKYEDMKIVSQQTKLTFAGINKSYENCDSHLLRKNESKIEKPISLAFAVLEISKLHMHETYYEKLQQSFRQESIQLQYVDTAAYVLSVNTKYIIRGLRNLDDLFDFSNLDENHELFGKRN